MVSGVVLRGVRGVGCAFDKAFSGQEAKHVTCQVQRYQSGDYDNVAIITLKQPPVADIIVTIVEKAREHNIIFIGCHRGWHRSWTLAKLCADWTRKEPICLQRDCKHRA